MLWEEFERMPWRFGWKHKYWDGRAHITPRESHVHVRMKPAPRAESAITPGFTQRAVEAADAEELIECFTETFREGVTSDTSFSTFLLTMAWKSIAFCTAHGTSKKRLKDSLAVCRVPNKNKEIKVSD